jgi:hypothetical protein
MRMFGKRFSAALAAYSLVLLPLYPAQNQAVGTILEAENSHIGNVSVTAGSTLFRGDLVSTESEGRALVRIGETRFQLPGDSSASFYTGVNGSVADLQHGSLIVSSTGATDNFEIYASDVRIVPGTLRPIYAQVTIVSPCELKITDQHGTLEVTSGNENKTIEENHSYRVVPEHTVFDTRDLTISPDDSEYHRGHSHKTCAAAVERLHGKLPMAAAHSHFLITTFAVVGGITAWAGLAALESPDRP